MNTDNRNICSVSKYAIRLQICTKGVGLEGGITKGYFLFFPFSFIVDLYKFQTDVIVKYMFKILKMTFSDAFKKKYLIEYFLYFF